MQRIPIAVVAALDDEIRVIRSRMSVDSSLHMRPSLFMRGVCDQRPLLLVRSGIGRKAMEHAAAYLTKRYRPAMCLHVGYCGGADPSLEPGEVILASPVIDSNGGERMEPDGEAIRRAERILKAEQIPHRRAGLVTVDAIARQPFEKAFLGTQHEAAAMDMESAALARACLESGTPFVVARAVLDPLDYEIPELEGALDSEGKTDGVALAGILVKRPSDIFKLPKMEYFASQARSSISALVSAWLTEEVS